MKKQELAKKVLDCQGVPNWLQEVILDYRSKISSFSMANTRIVSLYKIRQERLKELTDYKDIVSEIESIVKKLSDSQDGSTSVAIITNSNTFIEIFFNEETKRIIGILNLTGLGNTNAFMRDFDT